MSEGGAGGRLRILIVDDDCDTVESASLLFQLQGFDAFTAMNAKDALRAFETTPPHLSFIDLAMPEIDGFEIARLIRARPYNRRPTLFALTGYSHSADKQRCAMAGFDLHLTKPVDGSMLEVLATLEERECFAGRRRTFSREHAPALLACIDLCLDTATFCLAGAKETKPDDRVQTLAAASRALERARKWILVDGLLTAEERARSENRADELAVEYGEALSRRSG